MVGLLKAVVVVSFPLSLSLFLLSLSLGPLHCALCRVPASGVTSLSLSLSLSLSRAVTALLAACKPALEGLSCLSVRTLRSLPPLAADPISAVRYGGLAVEKLRSLSAGLWQTGSSSRHATIHRPPALRMTPRPSTSGDIITIALSTASRVRGPCRVEGVWSNS